MNDEIMRDLYERLGGIEAKLDDVRAIRSTANEADKKADMASQIAKNNSKDIQRLISTLKWAFGLVASILVPVALAVLKIIFGV